MGIWVAYGWINAAPHTVRAAVTTACMPGTAPTTGMLSINKVASIQNPLAIGPGENPQIPNPCPHTNNVRYLPDGHVPWRGSTASRRSKRLGGECSPMSRNITVVND